MTLRDINKLLAPLRRKMRMLVSRAVVSVVNDSLKRQNLQVSVLADETVDDVEHFQNYGHCSVAPMGSEAMVVSVAGGRAGLVALAVEDKAVRPVGGIEGDSILYHLEGHNIKLTKGGKAVITVTEVIFNVEKKATIISPETEIQSALHVTGPITSDSSITGQDVLTTSGTSLGKHKHKDAEQHETTTPL
ncbi:phage baseplate assembly protein V [Moritella viscosa]|uniref:Prophage MuSo2, baseplate assembly protein V n=1 Tax=Moritella viscosa TaxID=80854 RepID=A0ABY1HCI1_9GAMM|nr:phage baseplate assembly protein V [Moritella viscosa]SGY85042.1 Prophage MuSo2, baseplate assembly protein V [Moritella viscosa]SGY87213.1 Prophage MuSo2, baseplate assembly protein V [Moritella viscosa]SHO24685.1 Prophage MuSo2, baseplate assembly protein V [Moritella viscosa]